ncbi:MULTISPECIES: trypsin-like peptidase domain-containing protein [Cellvibrio]|jgi:serine protease DegS|uniref:Serine protease DegS n=1 Tax=Cellvibrio fibrivorans TaxID=126350 RepID=A0ABU1V318_9GAMM|nr:trypsin-like peptidase domain-containing protein [Cellvibrio fibrivorans]MDR7091804.1 serine protease DegS [Cellvibrio fibrivorans]
MFLQRLLQFVGWPITAGVIIALLALLLFPQLRGSQQPTPLNTNNNLNTGVVSYADAVNRAAPAVVNVYTEKRVVQRNQNLSNNPFFRHLYNNSNIPQQERMQKTLGSGVIVDNSGLILTNNHVINGADRIAVLLYDGRVTSAELIGVDQTNDLAVLKIQIDNISAITLGNSDNIRVGDVVLAIGNPFGVGQSVSQGIVSATGRWNLGINSAENFIQTDAAINPGNSGGALIDAHGNLIGINTAMLDETGASFGISFAVPVDKAMNSLKQIVEFGSVRRGWLGIGVTQPTLEFAQKMGAEGLLISEIDRDSPAEKAGFHINDYITHIDNTPLLNNHSVTNSLLNIQPNAEITFRIIRDGKALEIKAIAAFPPTKT